MSGDGAIKQAGSASKSYASSHEDGHLDVHRLGL